MSMICTKCGATFADGKFCVKCGGALVEDTNAPQDNGMGTVYVYCYRGSTTTPMSVYIDGNPAARIPHEKTVKITLPYGTHKMHIALGMTRNCNDLTFTLSPQNKVIYAKAYEKVARIILLDRVIIEQCGEGDIPLP